MNHVKIYCNYIIVFFKIVVAYVLLKTIKRELIKEGIWLIQEKRTEARDNGYHLFKYLREYHPEIPAYYVIQREAADYFKKKFNAVPKIYKVLVDKDYIVLIPVSFGISFENLEK